MLDFITSYGIIIIKDDEKIKKGFDHKLKLDK